MWKFYKNFRRQRIHINNRRHFFNHQAAKGLECVCCLVTSCECRRYNNCSGERSDRKYVGRNKLKLTTILETQSSAISGTYQWNIFQSYNESTNEFRLSNFSSLINPSTLSNFNSFDEKTSHTNVTTSIESENKARLTFKIDDWEIKRDKKSSLNTHEQTLIYYSWYSWAFRVLYWVTDKPSWFLDALNIFLISPW